MCNESVLVCSGCFLAGFPMNKGVSGRKQIVELPCVGSQKVQRVWELHVKLTAHLKNLKSQLRYIPCWPCTTEGMAVVVIIHRKSKWNTAHTECPLKRQL